MDTEAEVEVGTSQSHSRHKKGHMTNIYLTDSDEEAIVDFEKDYEELYDKNNYFGRFCYGKLTQSKSGQAPKEMNKRQNWIQDNFYFLKTHIRCKRLCLRLHSPRTVHPLPQHTTSPEV